MKNPVALAIISATAALTLLTSCAHIGVVRNIDPQTGRIETNTIIPTQAVSVLKSEKIDFLKYRNLALVLGGDYVVNQIREMNIFNEVVDRQGMEKRLIQEGKDSLVSDVTNLISWKKIYDNYEPFLVIQPDFRDENRTSYFQLKVVTPDNAEEVFFCEIKMDYVWRGVSDEQVFIPCFNAFLDWVDMNKKAQLQP